MTQPTPLKLATTQGEAPADVIDFGVGHPANALLPRTIMEQAAARRLAQDDASLLQYGLEQGDGYFRYALSRFLTRHYHSPVGHDSLFVTAGASQGLDLICTVYTQAGDVVFVEEPSYFLALRVFADHRLKVVSIATDEHGLVMEALEEALRLHRPKLLYVIPTHQNPSGATLPMARRLRLHDLANEYGFIVVADEVYHLLSYGEQPPPALACLPGASHILSLGSFSKILAPGLRLGWVQGPDVLIEQLVQSGLLDSGGGLNPFTSGLVRVAIEEGWQEEYLATLHATYRSRIAALHAALQRELGDAITYVEPQGGYFFWLRLADGLDASQVLESATHHKVGFRPGVRFSARGELKNYLRLSFAYYDADRLAEGAARLAAAVHDARPA